MKHTARTFDPWIGSLYWQEGFEGIRILILGESHYGETGTESSSFTCDVVKEWGQTKRNRFFTITQKLISGTPVGVWISDTDRKSFWEQVAFYNYVQTFAGEKPRTRPTKEMWESAIELFHATIKELKPHLIVALGFEIVKHLPTDVIVCGLQHPSSGRFRLSEWQEKVKSAKAEIIGQ